MTRLILIAFQNSRKNGILCLDLLGRTRAYYHPRLVYKTSAKRETSPTGPYCESGTAGDV